MKRAQQVLLLVALALSSTLAGCSAGGADDAQAERTAADTLTRRQKDSIISTLPIPGAGGVGRALDAADAAAARAGVHDSLAGVRRPR